MCLFISVILHYTVVQSFWNRVSFFNQFHPRPEMTGAGLLLLLLLLNSRLPLPAAAHDDACPMNASTPAPESAQLLKGILLVDGSSYPSSAYRTAPDGRGYVLCTCEIKPCVRKCCGLGKIYEHTKRCTKSTTVKNKPVNFTVSSKYKWSGQKNTWLKKNVHVTASMLYFTFPSFSFVNHF